MTDILISKIAITCKSATILLQSLRETAIECTIDMNDPIIPLTPASQVQFDYDGD
jgi:hypothetical protein